MSNSRFALATLLAHRPQEHKLVQGSPAWHQHRPNYRNSSDAAAMLGCDPHRSRADLLHLVHIGYSPEETAFKERIYANGHRLEALARPLAEAIVGEDLYNRVLTRGGLGASFDGVTIAKDVNWEHKQLNDELRAALPIRVDGIVPPQNIAAALPKRYRVQMEQQLLVDGAQRCLFTASDWTEAGELIDARHCWYESDPALLLEILAGWEQFDIDLATYVPVEVIDKPAPVGRRPDQLVAIEARVEGELTLSSNIDVWEQQALAYIKAVREHELKTDEDFADADAAAKWCDTSKLTLQGVRSNLMSATGDVNKAVASLERIMGELDATRISFTNAIKARKESRKAELVKAAKDKLEAYVASLDARLGNPLMPAITHKSIEADFARCVFNKKSFKAMQDALDQEVARTKIAAGGLADLFEGNRKLLAEEAKDHRGLFADWKALIWKAPDDLRAQVRQRIAEHLAEEKRKSDEAEAKRVREEQERQEAAVHQQLADEFEAAQQRQQQPENERPAGYPPVTGAYSSPPAVVAGLSAGVGAGERYAGPVQDVVARPAAAPLRFVPNMPPTLNMGTINTRLKLMLNSAFLTELGFPPPARSTNTMLWHEQDWPRICDALIQHVAEARDTDWQAKVAA